MDYSRVSETARGTTIISRHQADEDSRLRVQKNLAWKKRAACFWNSSALFWSAIFAEITFGNVRVMLQRAGSCVLSVPLQGPTLFPRSDSLANIHV